MVSCLRLAVACASLIFSVVAEDDPLRNAIMMKTKEELVGIAEKASLPHATDADLDTMRALIYEFAQREKPAHIPRKRWDGTEMPAESAGAKAPESGGKPLPQDMGARMFASLDKNGDGKLSREEMQPMIDKTNAAAKAAGETVPTDFFGSLDKNQDGSVDREEADEFFKNILAGKTPGGGQAKPSAKGDASAMSAALFRAMDKDGDGFLSKQELAMLVEKANADNKAKGLPEVNFFETMDVNSDGKVSEEESKEFFTAMAEAGLKDEL
jgi:Ca2+-binding EF-hand superfamily protein